MDRNHCVYAHINNFNGKIYVGQTKHGNNPNNRWHNGKNYTKKNKEKNFHFGNAILKYGWENFSHVILINNLTKKEANEAEMYYIKYFDSITNGYNMTAGGEFNRVDYSNSIGGLNPAARKVICLEGKLINHEEPFECIKYATDYLKKLNVKANCIGNCCKNHVKYSGKFNDIQLHWMYYEDYEKATEEEIKNKMQQPVKKNVVKKEKKIIEIKKVICLEGEKIGHVQYFDSSCEAIKYCKSKKIKISHIQYNCDLKTNYCGTLDDGTMLHWMWYDEYLNATEEEIKERSRQINTQAGTNNGRSKKVRCVELNITFDYIRQARNYVMEKYGVYCRHISAQCNNETNWCGKIDLNNNGILVKLHWEWV